MVWEEVRRPWGTRRRPRVQAGHVVGVEEGQGPQPHQSL